MKRIHYPNRSEGAHCSAWRKDASECDCRRCQFSAPFGFPPVNCSELTRELFNRR